LCTGSAEIGHMLPIVRDKPAVKTLSFSSTKIIPTALQLT